MVDKKLCKIKLTNQSKKKLNQGSKTQREESPDDQSTTEMVEDLLVYSHDLNSQESLSFSDKEEVSVLPLNLIQDEEEEENRRLKRRMKLKKKLGILLDKSNNNKEADEVFELTKTEEDIEQQQNLST